MQAIISLTRASAIERYTEIAHRLPNAKNPATSQHINNLYELIDEFDVFVLDGFGVLNLGESTIPGAVEQVAKLQKSGKQVMVLTNGATLPVERTLEKYRKWGMTFQLEDVISSRNALEQAVRKYDNNMRWGVIATKQSEIEALAPRATLLGNHIDQYNAADGFIFLSAANWTVQYQQLLHETLRLKARPVLIGNPDLVAPRENDMSLEEFYGKPFKDVFDLAAARITDVEPHRIAMVGDTLHTDILGGSSYGWRTVLVKQHGLMKEAEDELTFTRTGIRPHFIAQTT